MSRDEIRQISEIVKDDKKYRHFFNRINKEFESADEDRNSNVYIMFINDEKGEKVGFSVVGFSPAKMKIWQKTFKEEGWVTNDFKMAENVYELMYMYVKKGHRRQGVSTKLFKKTINFVKKKNVDEMYAYVGDKNTSAVDFYKKMNAQIVCDLSDEETSSVFFKWIVN
jgi:GNAT superfamily N-acetyltransferase